MEEKLYKITVPEKITREEFRGKLKFVEGVAFTTDGRIASYYEELNVHISPGNARCIVEEVSKEAEKEFNRDIIQKEIDILEEKKNQI